MSKHISKPAENFLKGGKVVAGAALESDYNQYGGNGQYQNDYGRGNTNSQVSYGSKNSPDSKNYNSYNPSQQYPQTQNYPQNQNYGYNQNYDNDDDGFSGATDEGKLKLANNKLRQQLKELNTQLDMALEKVKFYKVQGKNKNDEGDRDNTIKVKDKELFNAQIQINQYKKEIAALKMKVDTKTGYEKNIELENLLKDSERRNNDLMKEIKAYQKVQNNQGKALEKITSESEYPQKIKQLTDDLRVYKEKLALAEERERREENNTKAQFDLARKLEKQVRDLAKQLANSKNPNQEPNRPGDVLSAEDKIMEMESMRAAYEKARDSDYKKNKLMIKQYEKRLEEMQGVIDNMTKEVREKEQENRISGYKIKELKKILKHNQLKPIGSGSALDKDYDSDSREESAKVINRKSLDTNGALKHKMSNKEKAFLTYKSDSGSEKKTKYNKDGKFPKLDKAHKEEKHKDEKNKDLKLKGEKHKDDDHKFDKLKGDKHKDDKHEKDKAHKDDKHKDDKHLFDKHKDDKHIFDKHKDDKHKDDKHKDDKHPFDKHKDDKHKDDKTHRDDHKDDKHKGDKHKDEKNKDAKNKDAKDKDGKNKEGKDKDGKSKDGKDKDGKNKEGKDKDAKNKDGKDKDAKNKEGKDKDGKNKEGKDKEGKNKDGKDKNKDDKHKEEIHKNEKNKDLKNKDDKHKEDKNKDGKNKDEKLKNDKNRGISRRSHSGSRSRSTSRRRSHSRSNSRKRNSHSRSNSHKRSHSGSDSDRDRKNKNKSKRKNNKSSSRSRSRSGSDSESKRHKKGFENEHNKNSQFNNLNGLINQSKQALDKNQTQKFNGLKQESRDFEISNSMAKGYQQLHNEINKVEKGHQKGPGRMSQEFNQPLEHQFTNQQQFNPSYSNQPQQFNPQYNNTKHQPPPPFQQQFTGQQQPFNPQYNNNMSQQFNTNPHGQFNANPHGQFNPNYAGQQMSPDQFDSKRVGAKDDGKKSSSVSPIKKGKKP